MPCEEGNSDEAVKGDGESKRGEASVDEGEKGNGGSEA